MPVMEDKEKILQEMDKKINGISKTIEALFSVTKKQNEKTSEQVANQEETESESKKTIDDEKRYRIKTTKLLEEIRDKKVVLSGGDSGLLGGLIGLLGAGGLLTTLAGLATVINKLLNWLDGKESKVLNKPGLEAGQSLAGNIGAAGQGTRVVSRATAQARPSRVLRNLMQGKPIFSLESLSPEREYSRVTGERLRSGLTSAKTAATGVKPAGDIGPERKATVPERVRAGAKAVGEFSRATVPGTKFGVTATAGAGRSAFLGGTALGISTLFDPNLKDVPLSERLQQAGIAFGKGALTAGLVDLGLTTTAGAFSAVGLAGLARAVPIAGWLYAAGESLYRAYTASDWARSVAENEMIDQGRLDLENSNIQVNDIANEALRLNKEGKIKEAKELEERAVKIAENAQKRFFSLHNIVKTHEQLDGIVDMDLAWGKGNRYSIQDVNYLLETFKEAKDVKNADELYQYYVKKGADAKTNSILNTMGYDNVFALIKSGPEILKDYNTNLWARPQEYWGKHGPEITKTAKEAEESARRQQAIIESINQGYYDASRFGAMMQNEGIIEGSRLGSLIIAGENNTSEAVISTKPNAVTESIGNNLYKVIKEKANTEISATQKQTIILGTALANTIKEYNDLYKIAPITRSYDSAKPVIMNNMFGNGRLAGETNSHYNISGLDANNTETVLQKVYMDTYKAALL